MLIRFTAATDNPPDPGDVTVDADNVLSVIEGYYTGEGERRLVATIFCWGGVCYTVWDHNRDAVTRLAKARGEWDGELLERPE